MADHDAIAAYLKKAGLYDAIAAQAGITKDSPDAADVHVSTTGKGPGKKISTADIQADADDEEAEKAKKPVAKVESFELSFTVRKVADEQRKIIGWASVSSINGEQVIDKQGDIIPIEEIEKAADDFVLYSREQGDMHVRRGVGKLIRSWIFSEELAALGFIAKNENGEPMTGWAVGFVVNDDKLWTAIKAGERPELSIGGRASSVQVAG